MRAVTEYIIIFLLAGAIALFAYGYTSPVRMPLRADSNEVTCEVWADTKPWSITRCADGWGETVCYLASSGFMQCRFD